uniref:uncharacterized protein LOC122590149 n=1 Tax=Erigeron canadensis TaxID=72917 RepID=UPI001CB957C7|nr:uncharacterized protein LOC122590149 [Erigeron canadensis]
MEYEQNKAADLKPRSRCRWEVDGDENSRFLHRLINNRRVSNGILGLTEDGEWVSKPSLVKNKVYKFFKEKFKEDWKVRPKFDCLSPSVLSDAYALGLVERFLTHKIKAAVFNYGGDRAPGPDGFNFRFVKNFWDRLEGDFFRLFNQFYETGEIRKGCPSFFITLIHKVKDLGSLNDYRPITLVGIINKALSKVLANCLKKVLNHLISVSQYAFFKDRLILYGPLILNEIVSWVKKEKKKIFYLKVDSNKAYNIVNWSFLLSVMEQMSFLARWCKWILGTLSSSKRSYDCTFMGEWSDENLRKITRILRVFYIVFGLKINLNKSNLFGIGLSEAEVKRMVVVLKCKDGVLPFDHLGIRIGGNMNRVVNWDFLVNIFESRLSLWKSKAVSMAGRITLIKSVMESIPTYYFFILKVPDKILNHLEGLIRRFLWGGSTDNQKIHWVAWDRVGSPVAVGGFLGLSELRTCNHSLFSKWVWRFRCEHSALWRAVINALHNTKRCCESLPCNRSLTGIWKTLVGSVCKISVAGVKLNRLFKGEVGDGSTIKFWLDSWACEEPLKDRYPRLFKLEREKKCVVKERFEADNRKLGNACNWTRKSLSVDEIDEWNNLFHLLSPVVLTYNRNKWKWIGSSDGRFSVKSAKVFLRSGVDYSERFVFNWSKWVTKKCNVFMWRVSLDRLPTMVALKARKCTFESTICDLCGEADETIERVLCCCNLAVSIWYRIDIWCKVSCIYFFRLKTFSKLISMRAWTREAERSLKELCSWLVGVFGR